MSLVNRPRGDYGCHGSEMDGTGRSDDGEHSIFVQLRDPSTGLGWLSKFLKLCSPAQPFANSVGTTGASANLRKVRYFATLLIFQIFSLLRFAFAAALGEYATDSFANFSSFPINVSTLAILGTHQGGRLSAFLSLLEARRLWFFPYLLFIRAEYWSFF